MRSRGASRAEPRPPSNLVRRFGPVCAEKRNTAERRGAMSSLPAAFIPADCPVIYKVWVEGEPNSFDTSKTEPGDPRTIVHLSNAHALEMRPFPIKSYRDLITFKETAIQLNARANDVNDVISKCISSNHSLVCATAMLAWHLIDSDANPLQLSNKLDFKAVNVAVWAVLGVFRCMWHFYDYMSEQAMSTYLDCFYRIVGVLNLYNVTVHVSHQAVKQRGKSVAQFLTKQSHMCAINPVFVPNDSQVIYRVNVPGHLDPFDAPVGADDPEGRPAGCEVVHLWQDPRSVYTLQPLPREQYRYSEDPERTARFLESRSERVGEYVSRCHIFQSHLLCAHILMAWHLVDYEPSAVLFSDELDLSDSDLLVWIVLVVFRNLWAFRPHLSRDALHRYLTAFYQLVSTLNSYGVITHISHSPE